MSEDFIETCSCFSCENVERYVATLRSQLDAVTRERDALAEQLATRLDPLHPSWKDAPIEQVLEGFAWLGDVNKALQEQNDELGHRAERMERVVREARQLVECNEMAIADSERFDFYLNSLGAELRALRAVRGGDAQ